MASPRTVSDEFNDKNYQRKSVNWGETDRGSSIRKIVTEDRKTVDAERKKLNSTFAANDPRYLQTTDEAFNREYAKKGIQPTSIIDSDVRQVKNRQLYSDNYNEGELETVKRSTQIQNKQSLTQKSLKVGSVVKTKSKVTRLNLTIMSIGGSLWLTLQIPLAIFSLVFFGLAAAIYEVERMISVAKPDDNFLIAFGKNIAGTVIDGIKGIVNLASDFFGIDLTLLHPETFFLLTYILILGIFGIFQLFVIYLLYKLSFLNPLDGDWEGLKIGTLILCVVGYSIPLLNIFPWFIAWTVVVWLRPK